MERFHILLVDDDPLVRHVVADEIAEAGHFVSTAADGAAALALLAETEVIDLVLVDYAMPGMMGPDLIREIANRFPALKVALFTGYAEILEPSHFEGRPCPVIAKGMRMEELLKAIEVAARGEVIEIPQEATATRVEKLMEQLAIRPTVAGIQRQLYTLYERTLQDSLPQPLSRLLDKLGDATDTDSSSKST
ncbi:response regulator [Beijerinckia mobilis]|uniref:response regulator n=1 Tax=Beijerinckia mobilis TaxID=231434 RepID=UPI00054ECE50|nr:response regulator [Beijerinckia mobilis]